MKKLIVGVLMVCLSVPFVALAWDGPSVLISDVAISHRVMRPPNVATDTVAFTVQATGGEGGTTLQVAVDGVLVNTTRLSSTETKVVSISYPTFHNRIHGVRAQLFVASASAPVAEDTQTGYCPNP